MFKQPDTANKTNTASNFMFLFIAFPLGLIYFLLLVIGLAVGLSTIVIWIGLPILFATLAICQGIAVMERGMAASLLRMPMLHQPARYREQSSFIKRFGNYLHDPLTWSSMVYILLKFPLGIISLVVVLTLPIISLAILLLPIVYLINLFINTILLANGIQSTGYIIPYFIEVHANFDPIMFIRSFIGVPIGLVLWLITRHLLNALALASGELARALLCRREETSSYPKNEYGYLATQPEAQG